MSLLFTETSKRAEKETQNQSANTCYIHICSMYVCMNGCVRTRMNVCNVRIIIRTSSVSTTTAKATTIVVIQYERCKINKKSSPKERKHRQ